MILHKIASVLFCEKKLVFFFALDFSQVQNATLAASHNFGRGRTHSMRMHMLNILEKKHWLVIFFNDWAL